MAIENLELHIYQKDRHFLPGPFAKFKDFI